MVPEVETGIGNEQCSKGLPFTEMDQNLAHLLPPCKLLLLWCIIGMDLPMGPFRAAVTWHSRMELLTEGCESQSGSTKSQGLQKELAGNFPKVTIIMEHHIEHIQFCGDRGINTILFLFLNVTHKKNRWKWVFYQEIHWSERLCIKVRQCSKVKTAPDICKSFHVLHI